MRVGRAAATKVAAHLVRDPAPGDEGAVDRLRRAPETSSAETTAPRMLGAAADLFAPVAHRVDALVRAGRCTDAADRAHELLALAGDPDRRLPLARCRARR